MPDAVLDRLSRRPDTITLVEVDALLRLARAAERLDASIQTEEREEWPYRDGVTEEFMAAVHEFRTALAPLREPAG